MNLTLFLVGLGMNIIMFWYIRLVTIALLKKALKFLQESDAHLDTSIAIREYWEKIEVRMLNAVMESEPQPHPLTDSSRQFC